MPSALASSDGIRRHLGGLSGFLGNLLWQSLRRKSIDSEADGDREGKGLSGVEIQGYGNQRVN